MQLRVRNVEDVATCAACSLDWMKGWCFIRQYCELQAAQFVGHVIAHA